MHHIFKLGFEHMQNAPPPTLFGILQICRTRVGNGPGPGGHKVVLIHKGAWNAEEGALELHTKKMHK